MDLVNWKPAGKKVSNVEAHKLLSLGYKWCSLCKQVNPKDQFITNNINPSSLSTRCKSCLKGLYKKRKNRNEAKNINFTTKDKIPKVENLKIYENWKPIKSQISHSEAQDLFSLNLFWCPKCQKALPLNLFSIRRKKTFGVNEMCSKCSTKYKVKLANNSQLGTLKRRIRSTIRAALNRTGFKKRAKTEQMLCTTIDEFVTYLTKGNSTIKLREYQLDHICPCAQAKNEEELLKLQHYTNFQLLSQVENGKKNNCKTNKGEELCRSLLNREWINN